MKRPSRRRSARIAGYDYAGQGAYFVTICTRGKLCVFGEVVGEQMRLTQEGRIAAECWLDIPRHFADVALDEWAVMPNHVHGILIIEGRGTACRAPTYEGFGHPVAGSLPTIVRSYKAAVTRLARRQESEGSIWQRNYYEHVIRDDHDLDRIRRYIIENPLRWELDEENPARRPA